MSLVAFDIGGTSVKHGIWAHRALHEVGAFRTPETYEELLSRMKEAIDDCRRPISGVAISAPGAVDQKRRAIFGVSAVAYIHRRPIIDELESHLKLPCAMENDANCAGIAEVELGAGRDAHNMVFVVVGTGVGGSIFIGRQLYRGSHLFGGEFGLLKSGGAHIFSQEGTLVKAAGFYEERTGGHVEGKDLYRLREAGDPVAADVLHTMYDVIARNLYNIQVTLDPELVVLGGGVSRQPELATAVSERLRRLLRRERIESIMPDVALCAFRNDANLIGAALNFELRARRQGIEPR